MQQEDSILKKQEDSILKIVKDFKEFQEDLQKCQSSNKESSKKQQVNEANQAVTAMAFSTYNKEEIAVARGKEVYLYNVAFNQLNAQHECKKTQIGDEITAIHFPKNQNQNNQKQNSLKPFYIGTRQGQFFEICDQNENTLSFNQIIPKEPKQNIQNRDNEQNLIHQGQISCIQIVTIKNNELAFLTGGYDGQIKQFKTNQKVNQKPGNQLTITYCPDENIPCLKHGPKDAVFWISLSEIDKSKQTQKLICSGYEENFYIWERNVSNFKWKFQSKYKRNGKGSRIAFFGPNLIVWQIFQENYVNIIGNLKQQSKKSKDVSQNFTLDNIRKQEIDTQTKEYRVEICDNDKFPLLYNEEKKIMVIKFGAKIYFLKYEYTRLSKQAFQGVEDQLQRNQYLDSYSMDQAKIGCSQNCTEGALSQDANILVLYDSAKKELKSHRLEQIFKD